MGRDRQRVEDYPAQRTFPTLDDYTTVTGYGRWDGDQIPHLRHRLRLKTLRHGCRRRVSTPLTTGTGRATAGKSLSVASAGGGGLA